MISGTMARNTVTVSMSSHNWRTWALPCDWGGLRLMNCKTRAEAFAKRLHSKLRSLGGIGIVDLEEEEEEEIDADEDDGDGSAADTDGVHPNYRIRRSAPAEETSNLAAALNGTGTGRLPNSSSNTADGDRISPLRCNDGGNVMIVNRFWDEEVKMLSIQQPRSSSPSPTDLHSTFNFFGASVEMNGLHEDEDQEEDACLRRDEEEENDDDEDGKEDEEEEEQLSSTLAQTVKNEKTHSDIGQGRLKREKDAQLNGTVAPPGDNRVQNNHRSEVDKEDDEEEEEREEDAVVTAGDKMKNLAIHVNGDEEEEEDGGGDSLSQRVQRSSSLRTCKTPPGTPAAAKKMVRFADALGLDLEDVRTIFLDDLPVVPRSAFAHLSEPSLPSKATPDQQSQSQSQWHWVAAFTPPAALPDFRERLVAQKVCLESASALDNGALHAVVRVLNVHFEKAVSVRLSRDDWATWTDASAAYVPGSCDGFSDKFSVVMYADAAGGRSLSFAVRYEALGQQYWDNNRGQNYVFRSFPDVPRRQTAPADRDDDDPWLRFV